MRLFIAFFLLTLLITGCAGAPPEPTAVPTPTPTPGEVAAAIGRATQAAQSFHFVVTLSGKPVNALTGLNFALNSIEGDLKRPDGVLAVLQVTSPGAVAEIRIVSLEGKQYITNPLTRQWGCLPPGGAFDPAVLFDPTKGLEALLQEGLNDVQLLGIEQLDGRPHYHLSAVMDGPSLQAISLGLLGAGPVAVELWADQATMRASRLVLVDTASDPAAPSTWTMHFSDYDKTVEVRAPITC